MSQETTEEYRKFAEAAPAMRKVTLQFMKLNPENALPLFEQVYRYDPDPEIRQIAYDVLSAQGIAPFRDEISFDLPLQVTDSPIGGGSTPLGAGLSGSSALRDAGIGGLRANDSLSRSEEQVRRAMATDAAPAAPVAVEYTPPLESEVRGAELTGGTGRPVQRGEQLVNIFTLRRGNTKYLTGRMNRPDSELAGYMVGVVMLVGFLAFMLFSAGSAPARSGESLGVMALFFVGTAAVLVFLMVRSYRASMHFHQHAQLLIGQITSSSGRWVTTGSGKNRSRKYKVTIGFVVRTPSGEVLSGGETGTRGDLARGGLPERGEPVAVLVMPDIQKTRLL